MSTADQPIEDQIINTYRQLVQPKHPDRVRQWPLLSGFNLRIGGIPGGLLYIFDDTRNTVMRSSSGLGDLASTGVDEPQATIGNARRIREAAERQFDIRPQDGIVVLVQDQGMWMAPAGQLEDLLARHEAYLGLAPMKIFLSHKGVDKEMVRRFQRLLKELGFEPWLDDDAMPAGAQPDRAILQGFKDSCAAVFFVTPDLKDETWLATEIEYARTQKREKGDRFAIITLCLAKDGREGAVPELLKHYIYKRPLHELARCDDRDYSCIAD
jgi:hypothetical protein